MSNVVIDTNVLYDWAELRSSPGLQADRIEALAREHHLVVSSPTLVEMITRYRSDLAAIRNCLNLVFRPSVGYMHNPLVPVTQEQMHRVYLATSPQETEAAIREVVTARIDCEAQFIHGVLLSVFGAATKVAFASEPADVRARLSTTFHALLTSLRDLSGPKIRAALEEAYAGGEPSLKIDYADLLESSLCVMFLNIHAARAGLSSGLLDLNGAEAEALAEAAWTDPRFAVESGQASPLVHFFKVTNPEQCRDFLDQLSDEGIPANYPPKLRRNAMMIIEAQIFQGSKMKKNDIMDMMIMCAVERPDTVVLTLDKKFRSRLKELHPESAAFITSVLD